MKNAVGRDIPDALLENGREVYRGKDFDPGDPYKFFLRGKQRRLLLHPNTEALLETILLILKDEGEDAAFDYVRREILGK